MAMDGYGVFLGPGGMSPSPATPAPVLRETKRFCAELSSSLHDIANEPSVAMYRVEEHILRSSSGLIERRREVMEHQQTIQGGQHDVEYSIEAITSMHNIKQISNLKELISQASDAQRQIDLLRQERAALHAQMEQQQQEQEQQQQQQAPSAGSPSEASSPRGKHSSTPTMIDASPLSPLIATNFGPGHQIPPAEGPDNEISVDNIRDMYKGAGAAAAPSASAATQSKKKKKKSTKARAGAFDNDDDLKPKSFS